MDVGLLASNAAEFVAAAAVAGATWDVTKAGAGAVVDRVRRRFAGDDGATQVDPAALQTLAAIEADPADPALLRQLAEAIELHLAADDSAAFRIALQEAVAAAEHGDTIAQTTVGDGNIVVGKAGGSVKVNRSSPGSP